MKVEYEQLSLFELFSESMLEPTPATTKKKAEKETKKNHLQILQDGQSVWIVKRGDVLCYRVMGEPDVYDDDTRKYHAKNICWISFWNSEIGKTVFTNPALAYELAEKYIDSHGVIRKEAIQPIEVKAYHFIRSCDEQEMVAFYAILPDGKAYIKNFYTYHHIIDYGSVDKAKKKLEKDFLNNQGFRCENAEELLNPMEHIEFHNMYPCREDVDWDYADEGYSGCIGHDRLFMEH